MANLFLKQAKNYAKTRPTYPEELFLFIASKTPRHDLVWDVGTGSGQAAVSLAKIYKRVVGTDTSEQQLSFGPKLPNIEYRHTPPEMPLADLYTHVGAPSTVDLVTVAQALHWLDLSSFYDKVGSVLAKPGGVLAAWCYTLPRIDPAVDKVFTRLYGESAPYWAPKRRMVDAEYRSIEFPFDPVEGEAHTGPFEFASERPMDLEAFLTYIRSWSAYQSAKEKGVELLTEAATADLTKAWESDGKMMKLVCFPIFLRMGKVKS